MRHLYILIVSLLLPFLGNAQQPHFNKLYPETFGDGCILNLNDGYVVAGDQFIGNYRETVIRRLDFRGNVIWSKIMEQGPATQYVGPIIKVADGIVECGSTNAVYNDNNLKAMLFKLDFDGNLLWKKQYGANDTLEDFQDVVQTQDGGFLAVGSKLRGANYNKVYVVRTDSLGNLLWERTYGDSKAAANSVLPTPDGGFLIAAESNNNSSNPNFDHPVLIKINAQGQQQWERTYMYADDEGGPLLSQLRDGNFILTYFSAVVGQNFIYYDRATMLKLDSSGNVIWKKTYPGTYSNNFSGFFTRAVESINGELTIAAVKMNQQNNDTPWIIHTTAQGDTLWTKEYTTRTDVPHIIYDIEPTPDNGYVMCGRGIPQGSNITQGWVVKLDCGGCDSLQCYTPDSVCQAITGVQPVVPQQASVQLYPNPAGNYVTLGFTGTGTASCTLYNALGQAVHTILPLQPGQSVQVPVNTLPAGMYTARWQLSSGPAQAQRLVISH